MSNFEDVYAFHTKFDLLRHECPVHLNQKKLGERIEFMQEELNEFKAGAAMQNLSEQADALIDLVYVAMGTAVMLGLPWEDLWADVQRANMAKVRGVTKRGHNVDVTKPTGWVGPHTSDILHVHGYNRGAFCVGGFVLDRLCVSDKE